ncbi:MAG: plasmid partitioning protein RepA, partial [Verrucomicrobia bacterium]|nr:plasmid partitioning protein RepA [Verrucomicrobiota bacterium]
MNVNTRSTVIDNLIAADAQLLSKQLQRLREKIFPPESKKGLRRFTSGETAKLIGVSDSYLRQLSLSKQGPIPEVSPSGRRQYTLEQVNGLRRYIASAGPPEKQRHFLPHRTGQEHLQVIVVTNF